MTTPTVTVCLPVADRRAASRFYRSLLGREPFGAPAPDGEPEPLQFAIAEGAALMLIPTRGFGWVSAPNKPAPRGRSECLLSLPVDGEDEVRARVERVEAAGGTVPKPPGRRPWGFGATVADPDGHLWELTAGWEVGGA
ncbi:MAG TPA: VOC family protein [Capillimicrobium sp.]|jgi:predicted lactoylglutathione lyase